MKLKTRRLVLSLCLTGAITLPVYAESSSTISSQVQTQTPVKHHHTAKHNKHHVPQISGPSTLQENKSLNYLPVDLDVPGQSFVSTGPYLGIPLEYSGSNLIINTPSVNQDVALLKMRKTINQRLVAMGLQHDGESHSHILLSGFIEGQAMYKQHGGGGSSSDVDLTAANFDTYILGPSSWTSGLIDFAYDNDLGSNEGSLFNNVRTQNSRLFVNKAFIIIGDFAKSPFYGSIGQMYVPFGTYSTTMVSSPLTKLLARTQARALTIGYQQQADNSLYAAAYVFKGDSHGSATNRVNNGGLNFGYRMHTGPFSEDFGAGVIGNMSDSQTMQNTGLQPGGLFGGFGATQTTCTSTTGTAGVACGNERIVHRVPAYNLHGKFSIGDSVDILAEYITSSTDFNTNDLMVNSHGAAPMAFHSEAVYSFKAVTHPVSVGVGYDLSKDALPLGIPAKRYSLVANTSFWRNTVQSLEFRHDIDYSGSVTSSGSQVLAPTGTGRSDNVVTASMDLFF